MYKEIYKAIKKYGEIAQLQREETKNKQEEQSRGRII